MNTIMEYKGYKAKIMEAERLLGENIHNLPPGAPLDIYQADEFLAWPENWMSGPGVFLVPVKPNKGLWFDWRDNNHNNTAVVPTIKGANPITGMQTSGIHLEKYENKCPKHNTDFIGDRYCKECDYKWPPQNYVSSSNTLWWDGWLNQKDGTVRQFFFSEEELRDVAQYLIGKNTVPAFGFAFFSPKEPRPDPVVQFRSLGLQGAPGLPGAIGTVGPYWGTPSIICGGEPHIYNTSVEPVECSGGAADMSDSAICDRPNSATYFASGSVNMISTKSFSKTNTTAKSKQVSVGAGARISQALNPDPYQLDSWRETPDSVMTIYFVFKEKFEELKAGGLRDLSGCPEGMLANLPVG